MVATDNRHLNITTTSPLLERRTARYEPALDGLRAIAVAGAMAFHANVLRGGFLGVDLFFVLSGYLITGLLLGEGRARCTIDLARFYTRRVRRLAPALLVVLLVVVLWAYRFAPPALAPATARQAGWSLAYLNNWYALFGKVGYWGAKSTALPLNHLWSLAIEEQFYLVWPVLVLVMVRARFRLRQLRWVMAALALASGVWQWVAADLYGTSRAYLGTDTRFVALAIGATVAVLLRELRHTIAERAPTEAPVAAAGGSVLAPKPLVWRPRHPMAWNLGVAASVAFLALSWIKADLAKTSLYHGWLVACSVAAGMVIAAVVTKPRSWYASLLSLKPLVWIGKRSYSLYLWHWPIWAMFNGNSMGDSGADLWIVRLTLTVGVSALSYKYVESPIRNSALSGRRLAASLGPIAAGMAAAIVIAPPVLPVSLASKPVLLGAQPSGSGATASASGQPSGSASGQPSGSASGQPGGSASGAPVASQPVPPSPLRILVAGDSWGRNMGYALALADSAHRDTIIDVGVPGCGLLTPQSTGCTDQLQTWTHAEANDHPDVALLVEGTFDIGDAAQRAGLDAVCDAGYQARYNAALDTAIATLHGSANLPVFLTNDRDDGRGDRSSACMNQLLTAAAVRDSATLFDMNAILCPDGTCLAEYDGQAIYDETEHLAPPGQQWLGGLILAAMHSTVKPAAINAQPAPTGKCQTDAGAVRPIPIASYVAHPNPPYLDSPAHNKLIDGIHGKPTFWDPAWLGWQTMTTDIVEHLAAPAAICSVSSTWLQNLGGAVVVPPTIDVYVSNEAGQLGKLFGSAQAPQLDRSDQSSTVTLTGTDPVVGQYVTLRVNSFGSWTMVDEVGLAGLPQR